MSEIFAIVRSYELKLNPAKYAFGVQSGKFLGYVGKIPKLLGISLF